ncbi:MAG: MbnP family protein [Bacteroidota bacterium]
MTKYFRLLPLLVLSLLLWNACGEDRGVETTLDLQYQFTINDEPLQLGKTYEVGGTAVQFDIARFYVGGITLEPPTGPSLRFEDLYFLVHPEESNYEIGGFDFAPYNKMNFFVGIAPEINSQTEDDFTTRSANDPLSVQDPSMHWNWNSGYKFIRVDGQTDTDGDGVVDTPMAFHIGTDNLLKTLSFDTPTLQEGANTFTFTLDLNRLYQDINLAEDWSTHTGNNLPLAQQFLGNFEQALTIQ